jgi:hypothetical protein
MRPAKWSQVDGTEVCLGDHPYVSAVDKYVGRHVAFRTCDFIIERIETLEPIFGTKAASFAYFS